MKKIILFLFVMCIASLGYSQSLETLPNLLEVNDADKLSVHAEGITDEMKSILENPVNLEVRKIQFTNIRETSANSTLENKGYFKFSLPKGVKTAATGEIFVMPKQIESYESGNYTYFAELLYGTKEKGNLILTKEKDQIFGSMFLGERVFRISQTASGENLLIELDNKIYNSPTFCATANESSNTSLTETNDSNLSNNSCGSRNVRVLVLFTDRANNVSNPNQLSVTVMNELRSALVNSRIYSSSLTYQLVGTQRIGFIESIDARNDLDNLVSNNELNNLRQNTRADLVLVLTDGNYLSYVNGFPVGNILGAATLDQYSNPNNGHVAFVEADVANITFAHELGHLMGCRHDTDIRTSLPNLSNTAKGHNWFYRNWFLGSKNYQKSVVASGGTEGSPVLYFSNPAVKAHDKARDNTGTSTRNNFQQLRNAASVVSCYDPYDDMRISISGPSTAQVGESFTLNSSVSNCASRSYRWEVSRDGFSYSLYSTARSITYSSNPFDGNINLSFRLRVTCLDGQVQTTFHYVYVFDRGGPGGPLEPVPMLLEPEHQDSISNASNNENSLSLYPNPASDKVTMSLSLDEKKKKAISIVATSLLDGKTRILYKGTVSAGIQELSINTSSLDQGLYQIDVNEGGNKTLSKRLIVKR